MYLIITANPLRKHKQGCIFFCFFLLGGGQKYELLRGWGKNDYKQKKEKGKDKKEKGEKGKEEGKRWFLGTQENKQNLFWEKNQIFSQGDSNFPLSLFDL